MRALIAALLLASFAATGFATEASAPAHTSSPTVAAGLCAASGPTPVDIVRCESASRAGSRGDAVLVAQNSCRAACERQFQDCQSSGANYQHCYRMNLRCNLDCNK